MRRTLRPLAHCAAAGSGSSIALRVQQAAAGVLAPAPADSGDCTCHECLPGRCARRSFPRAHCGRSACVHAFLCQLGASSTQPRLHWMGALPASPLPQFGCRRAACKVRPASVFDPQVCLIRRGTIVGCFATTSVYHVFLCMRVPLRKQRRTTHVFCLRRRKPRRLVNACTFIASAASPPPPLHPIMHVVACFVSAALPSWLVWSPCNAVWLRPACDCLGAMRLSHSSSGDVWQPCRRPRQPSTPRLKLPRRYSCRNSLF